MRLQFVISNQTNPYWNIAVENHLLSLPETEVVSLYLWKNRRTVVIGQNQNPYSECNVEALEADGGYLMRRRTGGGAVYHDYGNINFSFIVPKAMYDQTRQFSVIQRAVLDFGIVAELSGRNDILTDGRKFSGNAFSRAATRICITVPSSSRAIWKTCSATSSLNRQNCRSTGWPRCAAVW